MFLYLCRNLGRVPMPTVLGLGSFLILTANHGLIMQLIHTNNCTTRCAKCKYFSKMAGVRTLYKVTLTLNISDTLRISIQSTSNLHLRCWNTIEIERKGMKAAWRSSQHTLVAHHLLREESVQKLPFKPWSTLSYTCGVMTLPRNTLAHPQGSSYAQLRSWQHPVD